LKSGGGRRRRRRRGRTKFIVSAEPAAMKI